MSRSLLVLVATLVAASSATACSPSWQVDDPRGDTNPAGLPSFYDVVGVNITVNQTVLTWSWDIASLENMRAVRYWGQFDLGNATGVDTVGDTYHTNCEVRSAVFIEMDCILEVSHALAGNAVTFERLGPLAFRIEGNRISADVPFTMLGQQNLMHIGHAAFLTQPLFSTEPPSSAGLPNYGSTTSPVVSDGPDALFALDFCPTEAAPGGDVPAFDDRIDEAQAPHAGLALVVAMGLVLVARRN